MGVKRLTNLCSRLISGSAIENNLSVCLYAGISQLFAAVLCIVFVLFYTSDIM